MSSLADHLYLVLRPGTGKAGNVLLRAREATVLKFGLDAFPLVPQAYYRNGGLQIGKWQTSPRRVNWQAYRIAEPQYYATATRPVGWTFSLSANHRQKDFAAIAQVIESSGTPWLGFQKASGARLFLREAFLAAPSPTP